MNEARQDGGPAFPTTHNPETHPSGMTLRDYFAGKALQGLVSCDAFHGPLYQQQWQAAADFAYGQADAMLVQRGTGDPVRDAARLLLDACERCSVELAYLIEQTGARPNGSVAKAFTAANAAIAAAKEKP